ncbi:MAG: hypothetical protein H8D78_10615 [Chloroflexi bacterium]|nr:hypothetical protein [Chloroflexota bacterium]
MIPLPSGFTLIGTKKDSSRCWARRGAIWPKRCEPCGQGLAPGQVREGLRLFSHVMPRVEAFLIALGQDSVIVEPLGYHNAILFERYGFMYTQGQREMEWIQQAFQPGGELAARLDGSTPFRQPEAAHSVRGRSWAIHDGILGKPWDGVKMIRRLAPPAGVDTAPGLPW